ncbi:hypothetical protein AC233_09215 [Burkholderia sp. HB1]|uniref:hypothetical protein n=1 Tax=Paraburkholderia graminis TaxID=60548 RepID=UPI0006B3EAFB|nr:hypothetical protein AC233_09215 [Burkholderia sp. HB1]MDR6467005.1 hypothetical protein [Paraburkholderia graminis]MDR6473719.1 hypothetical protein [Paraburkholderia graminis]
MSAHMRQIVAASLLPRAIAADAKWQAAAQSMSSSMHRVMSATPSSARQEPAQWPQASAHASQAEIQD